MTAADILKKNIIIPELKAESKEGAISELVELICSVMKLKDKKKLVNALFERESFGSTGIGDSIAIPHTKISGIKEIITAFGKTKKGIAFNSIDGKPVHFIFLIIAPENLASAYLKILARISKLLKKEQLRKSLLKAKDENELYDLIIEEDSKIGQ